jgi:hypothetical protein
MLAATPEAHPRKAIGVVLRLLLPLLSIAMIRLEAVGASRRR